MSAAEEIEAITAIKQKRFPQSRVTLDPNGADEAIKACKGQGHVMAYAEDPCGPEGGYSGREIMAEFPAGHGYSDAATNMVAATGASSTTRSSSTRSTFRWPRPHFWTIQGCCL